MPRCAAICRVEGIRVPGSGAIGVPAPADVETALAAALGEAASGDRILVFGTFHAAAAALLACARRWTRPLPGPRCC